jgi:tetratricopeptide (TPR) repeat protein
VRVLVAVVALMMSAAGWARAAEQPQYRPPEAWVKALAIPTSGSDADGAAQILLQDYQTAFGAQGDEFYQETAVKIRSAQGLSDWGNVIIPWQPDTETLVIHTLAIIRGDKTIDLLAGGKTFTVLRRETNLEMAMLDGTLTATIQPEGLQVGDVLHLAYTRQRHDPVMKGRSQDWNYLARPGVVERAYFRMVWPRSKPVRWKAALGLGQPAVSQTATGSELVIDMAKAEAPQAPRGAPQRFGNLANIQATDFSSWADASALMQPLYAKAATLAPDSPLRAEIARIKAASGDPKVRAAAALKLVEDQVRYLYLGLNNGGYVPADADVTWARRFGDCKAKTVLLLALLKGLGVEAQPALVSTEWGDGLDQRLPTMDAFDHVAVRARIGGKTYWLDGTRIGDDDLDGLPTPDFHWMLPVQAAGGALEPLRPTLYAEPHMESRMRLDASAGMDAPAAAHVEHLFRGDEGLGVRLRLQAMSHADLDRAMRGYWRKATPWIEPKSVAFSHDAKGVILTMDGSANLLWSKDGENRDLFIDDSNMGYDASFQREPGPNHEAPFAVSYPSYATRHVQVVLPQNGEGFILANAGPISTVVAGVEYRRTAAIDKGVASIDISIRSMAPEFPFAEAPAAAATLRDWGLHAVAIRSNPRLAHAETDADKCLKRGADALSACTALIQSLPPGSPGLAAAYFGLAAVYYDGRDWDRAIVGYTNSLQVRPDLPDAYEGRGAAYANKALFALALADYDQAIKLSPKTPLYWDNRGLAYVNQGKTGEAVADFTQALELDPKNADVLLHRATTYRVGKDWDHALADLDHAIALHPDAAGPYADRGLVHNLKGEPDLALKDLDKALALDPKAVGALAARGGLHEARGEWDLAIADLSQALALNPRNAGMLNVRCWVRAQAGRELDQALDDCGAAIAMGNAQLRAAALDSRGLVRIRLKQFDLAVADYDDALRLNPKAASSLYARGLAKRLRGDAVQGDADIASAKALKADVAQSYARIGLAPDAPPKAQARADAGP